MAVSNVGLGWPVGERNYDTLALWNTAKGGSGVFETAIIRGSVTAGNTNIDGAFSAGALIEGFAPYDGSNDSSIAFTGGNHTVTITSANVLLKDLKVDYNNNFIASTTVQGNNSFFERCLIIQRGTGATTGCVTLNNIATNKGVKSSVLFRTAGGALITTGFDRDAVFQNNIGFGYSGSFVSGTANKLSASNNFLFENTGTTFSGGSYLVFTNNATLDSTGNYTGYTSAELVDFAAGDYRVKSASDLFALNIGAFFQAGGATAYDDTLSGAVYSASIGTLASARGFNDTLNGVTYSGAVGNMIATRGLSSELSGATYSAEIGSLSSLRGYSSLLSAADYGAAIGELISTLDGATAYSDLLSGISATVAIGDLVSSVQRASILNGLAYGFSVGDFTSSAGYNSALSGVNYSSSIGQLTSTLSGEVTVTIEGYTIRFADSAAAAVYADDSISVIYAN